MPEFHISGKVGCVFLIVGVSIQSHAEIGRNDHQEGASHFIIPAFLCLDWNPVILNIKNTKIGFTLILCLKIRVTITTVLFQNKIMVLIKLIKSDFFQPLPLILGFPLSNQATWNQDNRPGFYNLVLIMILWANPNFSLELMAFFLIQTTIFSLWNFHYGIIPIFSVKFFQIFFLMKIQIH